MFQFSSGRWRRFSLCSLWNDCAFEAVDERADPFFRLPFSTDCCPNGLVCQRSSSSRFPLPDELLLPSPDFLRSSPLSSACGIRCACDCCSCLSARNCRRAQHSKMMSATLNRMLAMATTARPINSGLSMPATWSTCPKRAPSVRLPLVVVATLLTSMSYT